MGEAVTPANRDQICKLANPEWAITQVASLSGRCQETAEQLAEAEKMARNWDNVRISLLCSYCTFNLIRGELVGLGTVDYSAIKVVYLMLPPTIRTYPMHLARSTNVFASIWSSIDPISNITSSQGIPQSAKRL